MYHHRSYNDGPIQPEQQALDVDVDAMLFDVSNRMARAQLARQISSSSSTFRQRASRILKPNSVGGSPQNPQRRRTVTPQTSSRRRSELLSQQHPHASYSAADVPVGGQSSGSTAMAQTRPVSWHPTSMGINRSSSRWSSYDPPSRRSVAAYQTVAMNGLPTPMTQPDLSAEFPVDPFFSLDGTNPSYPTTTTQQQQQQQQQQFYTAPYPPHQYKPAGLSLDTTPTPHSLDPTYHQPYLPVSADYLLQQFPSVPLPSISASVYPTLSPLPIPMDHATQSWAESLSAFPAYTYTYTAPPTPDFLPIQNPTDMWAGTGIGTGTDSAIDVDGPAPPSRPRLAKVRSKELVGMGLYDTPERDSFSLDSATESFVGSLGERGNAGVGKGLVLEERWQLPTEEEEDCDGAEEGRDGLGRDGEGEGGSDDGDADGEEDEDEGEELQQQQQQQPVVNEEVMLVNGARAGTGVAHQHHHHHHVWDPSSCPGAVGKVLDVAPVGPYHDMSNQSFFFDDHDESYFDGLHYGPDGAVVGGTGLRGFAGQGFGWV